MLDARGFFTNNDSAVSLTAMVDRLTFHWVFLLSKCQFAAFEWLHPLIYYSLTKDRLAERCSIKISWPCNQVYKTYTQPLLWLLFTRLLEEYQLKNRKAPWNLTKKVLKGFIIHTKKTFDSRYTSHWKVNPIASNTIKIRQ